MTGYGAALAAILAACGDKGKESDTGGASSAIVVTDADNYSFTGSIDLGDQLLTEGVDFEICWDGLTTTLRGNDMPEPSSVDRVILIKFALDQPALEEKIETGTLLQSDADGGSQYFIDEPGTPCVMASDLEVIGNHLVPEIDLVSDPGTTWLASIQMLDPRPDILMSTLLTFDAGAAPQDLGFSDGMSTIDFTADLGESPTISVPAGEGPYSFDWSGLEKDAMGVAFNPLLADELIVGHVPTDDILAVEADFVRLYEVADELYTASVYGLIAVDDLGVAVDDAGTGFGGFTKDGTWLLALVCTLDTCTSPTPMFLAVVEVR
jgi:hypothetical protein